jgi:hypothetical protein
MKLFTCKHLSGHTFGVQFANGNMAKYVGKLDADGKPTAFATKKGAVAAGKKFEVIKGPNWEHGNLNYSSYQLVDGEMVEVAEFKHLASTY